MKSQDKKKSGKRKISPDISALNFFAEAGLLKNVKRSGWWVVGIKNPESVAEHCFRCAVIAFYMAHEEGVDPYKAMTMALFNDIHEARINDLHKMGHYYIDFKRAEKRVFEDQVKPLGKAVKGELSKFRKEYDAQTSAEAVVARDADILECLIQAKEYYESGHLAAKKFFRMAPDHLKTKTAKALWKAFTEWDSTAWWDHVVKFER